MSVVDSLFGMGTIFDMVQDRGYLGCMISRYFERIICVFLNLKPKTDVEKENIDRIIEGFKLGRDKVSH